MNRLNRPICFALVFIASLLPLMLPLSAQPRAEHGLIFPALATTWDEGIPLGNGMVGALVWTRNGRIRISLDRADLWDERPIAEFSRPEFRFSWVIDRVREGNYKPVQDLFDLPYDRDPAPTKIPAAALEFDTAGLGSVTSARLDCSSGLCAVNWSSGTRLTAFVHVTEPVGWYRFENVPQGIHPEIVPPLYAGEGDTTNGDNPTVDGQDLRRLGYPPPVVTRAEGIIRYDQTGFGKFRYQVATKWHRPATGTLEGVWGISAQPAYSKSTRKAVEFCTESFARGMDADLRQQTGWWDAFWRQSSISLPDTILERQWYLEMYKFGSTARRGWPPITLQAVWTADNGKLPPWKGDFHNDLNTQLSYWPSYSGNHLDEGLSFVDWLWNCRPVFEKYTSTYFGTTGLNVPGVCTLSGEPMGGWIQYSFSPTVSAWLAHHFYLQWRYSMDRAFLRDRAYPWIRDAARHIEQLSIVGPDGLRTLPLSSSPEINDNSIAAWFTTITNYDLALVRWLFGTAAELAGELGQHQEESRWRAILSEWPPLSLSSSEGGLLVTKGVPLRESHRHFSHLMAIHPLGLLDWDAGETDRRTISASLRELERLGPSLWTGYSYSWLGSMYARARDGERAAGALRTFAECFCLKNSFHVNGDQTKTGKSNFTYRPFTLEGNFAFAQGIQEMLLQSQRGIVRIFPALPRSWEDASFTRLRAEGAFLVSAVRRHGKVLSVSIVAERGGRLRLLNPFGLEGFTAEGLNQTRITRRNDSLEIECGENEKFVLRQGKGR